VQSSSQICHHQQNNSLLLQARCPSCHPTHNIRAFQWQSKIIPQYLYNQELSVMHLNMDWHMYQRRWEEFYMWTAGVGGWTSVRMGMETNLCGMRLDGEEPLHGWVGDDDELWGNGWIWDEFMSWCSCLNLISSDVRVSGAMRKCVQRKYPVLQKRPYIQAFVSGSVSYYNSFLTSCS